MKFQIFLITVTKNGTTEICQIKDIMQNTDHMTSEYSLEVCEGQCQEDRVQHDKAVVEGIPFPTIFLTTPSVI